MTKFSATAQCSYKIVAINSVISFIVSIKFPSIIMVGYLLTVASNYVSKNGFHETNKKDLFKSGSNYNRTKSSCKIDCLKSSIKRWYENPAKNVQ